MPRASDIAAPYLRSWRADKGLTQQELADKADVTRGTILRAESGKPVNVVTLAKLARALGTTPHDLRFTDPGTLAQTARG